MGGPLFRTRWMVSLFDLPDLDGPPPSLFLVVMGFRGLVSKNKTKCANLNKNALKDDEFLDLKVALYTLWGACVEDAKLGPLKGKCQAQHSC